MPTYQRPKGSLRRTQWDWNLNVAAWTSAQNNGGSGSSCVSLYNNSTQGLFFWVYGIQVNGYVSEQLYGAILPGAIGSKFTGAYPVIGDMGTPPGAGYSGNVPASADLINQPWTFQGDQPTAPFWPGDPFAIIPPNYSFAIYTADTAEALIATWWYLFLPYRY